MLYFIFSSLFCIFISNKIPKTEKIRDIIHENFSVFKSYSYTSDFMIFFQLLFSLFTLSYESIYEIFQIMSIIQILRGVCSYVTVLPPLKSYQEKVRLGGVNGNGSEYIFSGHASYAAISTIFLWKEKLLNLYFLIAYNILSQFFICASRNHYTVDVLLAWIIVPLLYKSGYRL